MTTKTASKSTGNMSDDAIKRATGKTWPQWCTALDALGCKKMTHKEIVAIVNKEFGIGPWWQQMVTVGYERERGLRDVHQKTDGYSFSLSRTMPASVDAIYDAWTKPAQLKRWMNGDTFEITKSTRAKSIRMKWPDDTRVNVMLYPKGDGKAQCVVEHNKIASATAMKKLKTYWTARIDDLQKMLSNV